jgi:hypothetical protein
VSDYNPRFPGKSKEYVEAYLAAEAKSSASRTDAAEATLVAAIDRAIDGPRPARATVHRTDQTQATSSGPGGMNLNIPGTFTKADADAEAALAGAVKAIVEKNPILAAQSPQVQALAITGAVELCRMNRIAANDTAGVESMVHSERIRLAGGSL